MAIAAGQIVRALDFAGVAFAEVNDDEIVSSTSYTGGSTPCGVVFTAPTSGRVAVHWYCYFETNTGDSVFVSVAVRVGSTVGSGEMYVSATDMRSLTSQTANADTAAGMYRVITGLNPGSVYNAQIEFRVTSGNADILNRTIMVVPLP